MTDRTLQIDPGRCQGHAICFLLAPGLFEVDDEGRGSVVRPVIGNDDDQAQALVTVDRCPERAISLRPAYGTAACRRPAELGGNE
jgi:ferredoxin